MADSKSGTNDNVTGFQDDLAVVERACREAGEIAMGFFGADQANDVWYKGGKSPVSEADMAVNNHLQDVLLAARPDYGWLSEETLDDEANRQKREAAEFAFVVDPIDGTRGFINHQLQWCISVAIVKAGKPQAGILSCPALEKCFTAIRGGGAFVNGKPLNKRSGTVERQKPIATGSRKLIEELRDVAGNHFEVADFVPSLAYRLAMVAEGTIDVAFARPGAKAWDVAAADLILAESNCVLKGVKGNDLVYENAKLQSGALIACPEGAFQSILDVANQLEFLR